MILLLCLCFLKFHVNSYPAEVSRWLPGLPTTRLCFPMFRLVPKESVHSIDTITTTVSLVRKRNVPSPLIACDKSLIVKLVSCIPEA